MHPEEAHRTCSPTTMSSPSKPFDIPSPRQAQQENPESTPPNFGTPISASPSPRFLRAQYAGTPPPANIPPRAGGTPSGTPRATGSSSYVPLPGGDASSSSPRLTAGDFIARRPASGTPGSGQGDNLLDELTDEDKARIVRKHLVSREERQNNRPATPDHPARGSFSGGSDTGHAGILSNRSSTSHIRVEREDTDPFPVPYDAPGADVT